MVCSANLPMYDFPCQLSWATLGKRCPFFGSQVAGVGMQLELRLDGGKLFLSHQDDFWSWGDHTKYWGSLLGFI